MINKILISGSSSGIGKAITQKLLSDGYSVIGLARRHEKFIPAETAAYFPYKIDFADIGNLENSLKTIRDDHADIDILVCCAGFGEFKELEQFSVKKIQELMNVNFISQAVLVKTFLPLLKKKKVGKIIFIGSECALEGQKKGTIYCASKFALRGFCQSLRKECVSSNISISLINPGMTQTAFFDDLEFQPGTDAENAIQPQQIAEYLNLIIHTKNNAVLEEINLQPLKKVVRRRVD